MRAADRFRVGQRIALSALGRARLRGVTLRRYLEGAVVVGFSRLEHGVRIRVNGQKSTKLTHGDYWEPLP